MIRSPWVARRLYDLMQSTLQSSLDNERRLAAEERQRADLRYQDLMASYRLLRMNGHAQGTAPVVTDKAPVDETKVAISRAIREQSGGNAELAKLMWRQVGKDREEGLQDPAILQRIEDRFPLDEGVPA